MAGEELQRVDLEVLQQRHVDGVVRQRQLPGDAVEELRLRAQQLVERAQRLGAVALHPGARLREETPVHDDASHVGPPLSFAAWLSTRRRA